MRNILLVAAASFLVGAGVTYVLTAGPPTGSETDGLSAPPAGPSASSGLGSGFGSSAADAPEIAEQARIYQSVANADIDELQTMVGGAIGATAGSSRNFELEVIFARIVELDPERGLGLARDLDSEQALGVALDVIDALGFDERTLNRVLAALPQIDEQELRERAIGRLAERDPRTALAYAVDLTRGGAAPIGFFGPGGSSYAQLMTRVATAWVRADPQGALAAIESIDGAIPQSIFAQTVLSGIAQSDPELALSYVERLDIPQPQKMGMLATAVRYLAERDPERALDYARSFGGQLGQMAEQQALQVWAQRDPQGALAYVDSMPPGMMRNDLLQSVAMAYARSDPEAALAWVQQLGSSQVRQQIYSTVLAGLAQSDPARALDLAFDQAVAGGPGMGQALMSVIGMAGATGALPFRSIADRVLALENGPTRQSAVQILSQQWAQSDADAALNWFIANQEALGPNVFEPLVVQIAQRDPLAAAAYLSRIPAESRDNWIVTVAGAYSRADPAGAQGWLQQFRGQEVYDSAVAAAIQNSAFLDPAGAASLLQSLDPRSDVFANQVRVVASAWGGQDFDAARNWAQALPAGRVRDNALHGLVSMRPEIPEPAILALFSSDRQRQDALANVITQIANFEPDRARALVQQHIDDPGQRQQIEQTIENMSSRGVAFAPRFSRGVPAIGVQGDVIIAR